MYSVVAVPVTERHIPKPRMRTASPDHVEDCTDLMRRHLDGDDTAFISLFTTMNHRLYLYALKLLGNEEQAEDLTQELWEKVIHLRGRQHEPVHNAIAFLVRMSRNLCYNHIKMRNRTSPLTELEVERHAAQRHGERSEREEAVHAALEELPVEYREVLVLHVYCGYQFDEIAVMLEKTPQAIWKRASRARARLRERVLALDARQA